MAEALPTTPAPTADRESREALKRRHASDNFPKAYLRGCSHNSQTQPSSSRSEDKGSRRPTTSGKQNCKPQRTCGPMDEESPLPFLTPAWPAGLQSS